MATVPRLIEISIDAVPIGTPLQFALRSNSGHLLASKGYTITSRSELEKIRTRGLGLAIDMNESDAALRSYLQRVNSMILDDASLANIAMARIESFSSGTIEPMTVAGKFYTRQEAWRLAQETQQILHRVSGDEAHGGTLFSENLY